MSVGQTTPPQQMDVPWIQTRQNELRHGKGLSLSCGTQSQVLAHAPVEGSHDLILIAVDLQKNAIYPYSVKNKDAD